MNGIPPGYLEAVRAMQNCAIEWPIHPLSFTYLLDYVRGLLPERIFFLYFHLPDSTLGGYARCVIDHVNG